MGNTSLLNASITKLLFVIKIEGNVKGGSLFVIKIKNDKNGIGMGKKLTFVNI